jgi:hypothetical protein
MESLNHLVSTFVWFIPLIVFCVVWDSTWKLIAMWKAGRNNELAWFICLAIFNTMGILPIIYILLRRNNTNKNPVAV